MKDQSADSIMMQDQLVRQAYDVLAVAVLGLDGTGKLIYANHSAVTELGLPQPVPKLPVSRWLHGFSDAELKEFKDQPFIWKTDAEHRQVMVSSSFSAIAGNKPAWYLIVKRTNFTQKKEELLTYLNEVAHELARVRVTAEALEKISQLIVPRFANWFAIDVLKDGKLEQLILSHEDPAKIRWAQQYRAAYPTNLTSDRGAAGVLKTGRPFYIPKVSPEMIEAAITNPEQRQAVEMIELRSVITAPLFGRERISGVITFISTTDGHYYDESDLSFAQNLAGHIGMALENARLNEAANTEISLREATEVSLQMTRERLQSALSSGLVGTWILDVEKTWLYADENLSAMFGIPYQPEGCPQVLFSQKIHPDDRQLIDKQRAESIAQADNYETEYRVIANGRVRWCFARGRTETDEWGKPIRFTGVLVDVTRRKVAELALRESEEKYSAAFQNASVGILLSGLDGTLITANTAFSSITGYSQKELAGMNFRNITHPDDLAQNILLYQQLIALEIPDFVFEKRYFHKNGTIIWVRNSTSLVRDHSGQPTYTISITEDITEQKDTQERLRESEERFRFLANAIPHKLWTSAPDGKATYYNQGWCDYLGSNDLEQLRELAWNALHPDDRAEAEIIWPEAVHSGKEAAIESRLKRYDGQYRWHLSRFSPHRDQSGAIRLWVGTATDIHELKLVQQALESSEAHFKALAELNSQPIWQINSQGDSVFVNQAWRQYTGIVDKNLTETHWAQLIHPDDRREAIYDFNNLFSRREPIHLKYRFRHAATGEYRWILNNAHPVFKPGFYGYIGTMTDIHEQEQARLAVQQLMQQKDEFISVASHELKTPLTTIKAFFQLIQQGIGEGHRLYTLAGKADNQLRRLERLIEELLDVSRVNAGKMTYYFEHFVLMDLVNECLENIRESYPEHLFVLNGHSTTVVYADRHRIEQLLMNLLNNAVKYAPNVREVRVNCRQTANYIEIDVQDFGIGIAPEHLEHLFERFYRVAGAAMRFQGLGLGLFICADIVKRHNGEIRVISEPGGGSTFTFTLPAQ